jgi:hypothetical protein
MTETQEKKELNEAVENIERMMVVIDIKSWLALGAVLLVVVSTALWGFFGSIQIQELVSGVLVRSGKIVNVYAVNEGILLDFNLVQGMFVERDQVLARIEQEELYARINGLLDAGSPQKVIEEKRDELFHASQIVITRAGRVIDVYVHQGDYLKKGQKLATISEEAVRSKALQCLLYVPADQMRNLKKGLAVSVYPTSVSKRTFGSMKGTINRISEHPVTRQYLYDRLNSEDLAEYFLKNSACYEVYLNLAASEKTATGYEWTTSLGPPEAFGDLTLCTASVVTNVLRPIDVFFLRK